MNIRVVKTASGARAVQVVRYQNNRRKIIKHFGSCHTDEQLDELLVLANEWIKDYDGQMSIFPDEDPNTMLHINHCSFLGVYYTFFYDLVRNLQKEIGFADLCQPLLQDLVAMRLFEPASKLRSIELIATYFGIKHQRKSYCKIAPLWLSLKQLVQNKVVDFARKRYSFTFDLLFYDVTTLYFETFEEDDLRKNGFSKDNKSQQPQILIALMVSKEGFPVAYEVFPGNTFEGHTIIPIVKEFIDRHSVKSFTIVADAAMISSSNIEELLKHNINYIVGARLGNLSMDVIQQIDNAIEREDGKSIRITTDKGYLICSYSSARYRKDKYEMEKQIEKAKTIITKPSKNKKLKFTKSIGEKLEINQALIEKTQKLLGIKAYYTNISEQITDNQTIINRYHELYRIEQAFRISKSDLQTRPIFHFKEDPIKLHVLVCFMALVLSKHIELVTGSSIKRFITEIKKVTQARIMNHITKKEIKMMAKPSSKVIEYLTKLNTPH